MPNKFSQDILDEITGNRAATGGNVDVSRLSPTARQVLGIQGQQTLTEGLELLPISGLPDEGKIYKLPDGTLNYVSSGYSTADQDEILNIIRKHEAGKLSVDPAVSAKSRYILEQDPMNVLGAMGAKQLYGLPFVGSRALGALEDVTGAAGLEQRAMRAKQALEQESPGLAATTGGVSMGATSGGLYGASGQLFKKIPGIAETVTPEFLKRGMASDVPLKRAISSAAVSAPIAASEGMIYASGQEGASPLFRGGVQAGIATVLSGLGTPLGAAVNRYVNRASKTSIAPEIAANFNISIDTARIIERQIAENMDLRTAIANIKRAGDQGMILDADEATKALMDAAISVGGTKNIRAGEKVISDRIIGSVSDVDKALTTALGPRGDPLVDPITRIRKRTEPFRNEAYRKAYSTPIDYNSTQGERILDVFGAILKTSSGKKMIGEAIEMANAETALAGVRNTSTPFQKQLGIELNESGELVRLKEYPNMYHLDMIKRKLDEMGQETDASGKFTRSAQIAQQMAKELRDAVSDSVPAYRRALAIGGDAIQEEMAFKFGSDKLFKPKEQLYNIKQFTVAGGAGRDTEAALKEGVRSYITRAIDNVKVTAGKASSADIEATRLLIKELSSNSAKEKLRKVLGDAEANQLIREIDKAKATFEVRADIGGGSATARRQALEQDVEETLMMPAALDAAMQLQPKQSVSAIQKLLQSDAAEEAKAKFYSESIDFLTGQKGRSARQAVLYLKKAQAGKRPTDAQARFIAEEMLRVASKYPASSTVGREYLPARIPVLP